MVSTRNFGLFLIAILLVSVVMSLLAAPRLEPANFSAKEDGGAASQSAQGAFEREGATAVAKEGRRVGKRSERAGAAEAEEITVPSNEPEVWSETDDYTLRVQKKTIPFPGARADGGPNKVDVITYNGHLVGPTIRVHRGTTLKIRVINELPLGDAPPLTVLSEQTDPPHDLYTTNLHTHGLHVDPTGRSDDVFREIRPGRSFQYCYTIPADHPSGTFWYHPHKHGSVAYQIGNGLAGALIVEGGGATGKVRDLEDIPEIAAAKERILVLQQLILQRDKQGVGWVDPNDVYNEPPRPNAYEATAINGVVLPTYAMQPGEVQRWRFICAGRADALWLRWGNEQGMEMRSMHFGEIAVDGLARGALWLRRDLTLYPGGRSDVLIKAPATRGTYYLMGIQENESPAPGEPVYTEKRLARLVVQGAPRPMNFPTSAQLRVCKPFESIDPAECKVKRNLVFQYDDKKKVFRINGLTFSEQTHLEKTYLGTAEEWTLSAAEPPEGSANEPHPFHLHVNPFQVVKIEKVGTKVVWEADEWRDTIAVETGKKITIRIRFRDFAGKTVFHCHTLDHGDQGMMHAIRIVDPQRAGDDGKDPTTKLIDCLLPAPPLTLPSAQGGGWTLKQARQRPVVLVFFRGMRCIHCTQELRRLIREAQDLAEIGTTLVAVSSESIPDPLHALKSLKVPPGLDFSLLLDERQESFRAFGCYDDGPQHGLFVIDKNGTIQSKYVGDAPFANPHAVLAQVHRILASHRPSVP